MLDLISAGWCRHPECSLIRGGGLRRLTLPSGVAIITHPQLGLGLFDTGYSQRFLEATRAFPERVYRWLTPPLLPPGASAREQLAARGHAPEDVRWIVLSHLHADHIAGLIDFPRATLHVHRAALVAMRQRGRWANLLHGVLPSLLPDDLDQRVRLLDDRDFAIDADVRLPCAPLGDDGSLSLVALPGHADGQMGLLVRPLGAPPSLLVADATWLSEGIRDQRSAPWPTTTIFASTQLAERTLRALHDAQLRMPDLRMVPSHCPAHWPRP